LHYLYLNASLSPLISTVFCGFKRRVVAENYTLFYQLVLVAVASLFPASGFQLAEFAVSYRLTKSDSKAISWSSLQR
jgi:hypothetical protein